MKSHSRVLGGILLLLASGCASPYVHRDGLFNEKRYTTIQADAVGDLSVLGQFSKNGFVSGILAGRHYEYDTKFYDLKGEAVSLVPLAYYDMARVSLKTGRYTDAVRGAKNSIAAGQVYFREDEWALLRLTGLLENHKLLYESYLYLGDVERASQHHKQYLMLAELMNSKTFKILMGDYYRLQMTAMQLRSDFKVKQAEATMAQIAIVILAVLAASGGGNNNNNNNSGAALAQAVRIEQLALLTVVAVQMLEAYKQELRVQLNMDLSDLLRKAGELNRMPPPTPEDMRRAKQASSVYLMASMRDPARAFDQAKLADLRNEAAAGRNLITIRTDEKGLVHVSGDLAKWVALCRKIDEVPMRLPPPPANGGDAYLDRFMTPALFRMAGTSMTPEEVAYFDKMVAVGGQEFVIDPSQAEAQVALNGLRKMTQKEKDFETWVAAL